MELNSNQIQEILPHRYPFQLVDRITDFEPGKWAKGVKCVSVNEMQFLGHFPTQHVMPGVLVIEALAQVGAIAILSEEEHKGKTAFFGGIKNARFKKQITPGDVIEMECEIMLPLKESMAITTFTNRFWKGCRKGRWKSCCNGRTYICRRRINRV